MRKILTILGMLVVGLASLNLTALAQDSRPELMYFRFDEPGQSVTPNKADPATRVSTQGVLQGAASMGGVGQFGSALVATGNVADYVNTGWSTNLGSNDWTISMWINNVNGSTFGYYFGDASTGGFRCFNAGAAGTGNILLRGPSGFSDVNVPSIAPGPTVIHFVYDGSANEIRAYKNGVLAVTRPQGSFNLVGTGQQFRVGSYSGTGGSGGFPAGALMDEFRMYSRALTAQEIADTWDEDVDCFIPDGAIGWEFVDASGAPAPYVYTPGTAYLKYNVDYPAGSTPVGITVDFYSVPADVLVYTATLTDTKPAGSNLNNIQAINIPPTVPAGIYRAEVTFNTTNSCDVLMDYPAGQAALFILDPGTQICIVWPGDVNNDAVVNYGDKKSLTAYIHEANLRSSWLQGPARYRADAGTDPLTYLAWEPQPAVPWQTPDGCYMDSDGNGTINNMDFIAMKMNWMRNQGDSPTKQGAEFSASAYSVSDNFPNPFNPSTNINYSVPEKSQVTINVVDMLGREVATLVDGVIEAGTNTVTFDAQGLQSGTYIATVTMNGLESGTNFTKTVRMTLNK